MRGSHLLVRCPKWTPLSSRAFIGITAMISPNFCRSPTPDALASARNGVSLVGIRLYEPDPLRDACCPSQARCVALGFDARRSTSNAGARLYHRNWRTDRFRETAQKYFLS